MGLGSDDLGITFTTLGASALVLELFSNFVSFESSVGGNFGFGTTGGGSFKILVALEVDGWLFGKSRGFFSVKKIKCFWLFSRPTSN